MGAYEAESKIADLIGQSKQLQERTQALSDEHQALSVEFDLLSPENKCAGRPPVSPVTAPGQ